MYGPERTDNTQARRGRTSGAELPWIDSSSCGLWALMASARLAGLCGGIIAFAGTQRDVIRVGLQQRKQSLGGLGRHLFFFDDSPCARVAPAVACINADPVRRVAHHRPERLFPALIRPEPNSAAFQRKNAALKQTTHTKKADDRRSGRAALSSPA